MFLRELRQPVTTIPGIGEKNARLLARMEIRSIADLLSHIPRSYEDRKTPVPLSKVQGTTVVNTVVHIVDFSYFGFGPKRTLKVLVEDETGRASLVCFNRNFLADYLHPGKKYFLYGTFQARYGELQSSLFDLEPWSEHPSMFGRLFPVYPLTEGIGQKTLRKAMTRALDLYAGHIDSELPASILQRQGLCEKTDALFGLHIPVDMNGVETAHRTLAFEELFYLQLLAARGAAERRLFIRDKNFPDTRLIEALRKRLPFRLTEDQNSALTEILDDMAREYPMARLLQGDVGSGKTLIAFMAAISLKEQGGQTAFMAPTELLARQHAENASRLLSPLGIHIAFLSGNLPKTRRELLVDALRKGDIDILVGTHALFSNDIEFRRLRLAVIDEQHRFGVLQRNALIEKGPDADLLMMTATPIPRSLALTVFGDLEVSTIKTMPPGRKPVITHLALEDHENRVYDAVRGELQKGRQAYFVYPLIRESQKMDIKDAESMYRRLQDEIFPEYRTALIHSRIDESEKRTVMEDFNAGRVSILAATSVVEVGVDVPNATCMVIEHADRFGLSALHQLRGRVGRGEHQSYAFLIFGKDLSDDAKERLRVMKEHTDGFFIAEEDLRIRGPGNLAGVQQSGFFRFLFADPVGDTDLLSAAREEAFTVMERDPGLLEPEHAVLRTVLDTCPPFDSLMTKTV